MNGISIDSNVIAVLPIVMLPGALIWYLIVIGTYYFICRWLKDLVKARKEQV